MTNLQPEDRPSADSILHGSLFKEWTLEVAAGDSTSQ